MLFTTCFHHIAMNFIYLVLLKPSEIRFTKNLLPPKFDNGIPLKETFTQIKNGEILLEDIPLMEVVFYRERWEWYTLNNRRLWVLQELEKIGKCQYIKTKRVEYVGNMSDYPSLLYGSAAIKESSRSFTWQGDSLQITSRGWGHREIDVFLEEDENDSSQFVQTRRKCTNERWQSRCEDLRQRRCYDSGKPYLRRKRRRFHPYSRYDSRLEQSRQERLFSGSHSRHVVEKEYFGRGRHYSMSSESSSSVYGFQFSYTVWYERRQQFLRSVYCFRTGRLRDPSRFIEYLFTCGVCFKTFKSKVSLNQHSEELFHWACVRCGRFFGSHTALGQHKLALSHTI